MHLQPGTPAREGAGAAVEPRPPGPPLYTPNVRVAYLMMLASSLSFAGMSACSHAAGERSDWRLAAVARAGLVFLFTAALARARGVALHWRGTRTLWIRSITGSVSMLLTFYALTHLPVATAVTLSNTFPLWVTLLAWPALRQRPTVGVGAALLSGIAGVALIEQPQRGDFRWASLAALGASFCTAIVMIGLHRLRHYDPLVIVVHFSAVASGFIGGFTLWTAMRGLDLDLAPLADPATVTLLVGIGVLGAVGQILMTTAFRVALPQRLSVIGLSQVLFALGFDLFLWERRLDATLLVGIALIVAPVAWLLTRRGK
jgi:drug/metabolite transporter (DMT)-like permease